MASSYNVIIHLSRRQNAPPFHFFLELELIDAGDITRPDPARREQELAWIRGWLDVASAIGASHFWRYRR
ncbi:MAG: hypothetical protein HY328_06080 [Chloroflexi bacterium]|nr:hypothetical protein [Chloroflexota bacterium]